MSDPCCAKIQWTGLAAGADFCWALASSADIASGSVCEPHLAGVVVSQQTPDRGTAGVAARRRVFAVCDDMRQKLLVLEAPVA